MKILALNRFLVLEYTERSLACGSPLRLGLCILNYRISSFCFTIVCENLLLLCLLSSFVNPVELSVIIMIILTEWFSIDEVFIQSLSQSFLYAVRAD